MTTKSAMQIVDELERLLSAGNINTAVARVVENWNGLQGIQDLVLTSLADSVNRCRQPLSSDSRARLQTLPVAIRDRFLPGIAIDPSASSSPPAIGRIWFPVVTSFGMVHELAIASGCFSTMQKERHEQLDRVGAATVSVLGRRIGMPVVWHPKRYSFWVFDPFGREDGRVDGNSMDLPLALALYSQLTQAPVPPDVSASAEVCRDGALKAVGAIDKKIETLVCERPDLSRVLVADGQDNIPKPYTRIAKQVADLQCALELVFPDAPAANALDIVLDITSAAATIQDQYDDKFYDTCLMNAEALISYLKGAGKDEPEFKRIPALFTALWRRGSCLGHKGDVDGAMASLAEAVSVYEGSRRWVREESCAECRNSYGVALRDVFRYSAAKEIHCQNEKDLKRIGTLGHIRAKNLSSLSQLYLAWGKFSKAAEKQNQVLGMIQEDQKERNYGLLAQICARWGRFDDAAVALDKQQRLLDKYCEQPHNFRRWIQAEFFYRQGIKGKRDCRTKSFANLHALADQVLPEGTAINHYTIALVLKFDGLARLAEGDEKAGLDRLKACIAYFDAIPEPMFPLIGAGVRAERALYHIESRKMEKAVKDVIRVAEVLTCDWFFHYFESQVTALEKFRGVAEAQSDTIRDVVDALKFVRDAIPY
jgi:tetratricopeptide (TPR) repeat protein